MGRQERFDVSAACFGSLLDCSVTVWYCALGPARQDSTAGLCLCILCMAFGFRVTLVTSGISVLHSVDKQPALLLP